MQNKIRIIHRRNAKKVRELSIYFLRKKKEPKRKGVCILGKFAHFF